MRMVMSTCAGVDEHYLDRVVESVKNHEEHVDVHDVHRVCRRIRADCRKCRRRFLEMRSS